MATYYTGPVKPMPPASARPAGMGDLEWQVRNWYNFVWLSGDGYLEQACHSVDKVAWAFKDQPPLKAVAVGGRQTPNHEGNIFDHMFVVYEFPNDVRGFLGQKQIGNGYSDNSDYLMGSEGIAKSGWNPPYVKGKKNWRYRQAPGRVICTSRNTTSCSPASVRPTHERRPSDGAKHAHGPYGPDGGLQRPGSHLGAGHEFGAEAGARPSRLEHEARHCTHGHAGRNPGGLTEPP